MHTAIVCMVFDKQKCLPYRIGRRFLYVNLNRDSLAVVDLVLYDLHRPGGEGAQPRLEFLVLPLYLDGPVALRFPCVGQGHAALLDLICTGLLDDHGIEHEHGFSFVVKRDDAPAHAEHVRRHAHAALSVRSQRVQQILRRAQILCCGRL